MNALPAEDISASMIYTNAAMEIAYVNLHFLRMMQYDRSAKLIGKSLADVMHIPADIVRRLMQKALTSREAIQVLLEMRDPTGMLGYVVLNAVGAYGDSNEFIGLTITFEPILSAHQFLQQDDPLVALVDLKAVTTASEPASATVSNPGAQYVVAEVEGLQIFLARIIGMGMRNRMESAINVAAERNSWPLHMHNGELDLADAEADIYQNLLDVAWHYAADVAGHNWVLREIHNIEDGLDPQILQQADALGLRNFIR